MAAGLVGSARKIWQLSEKYVFFLFGRRGLQPPSPSS